MPNPNAVRWHRLISSEETKELNSNVKNNNKIGFDRTIG